MTDPSDLPENDVLRVVLERSQQVRQAFDAVTGTHVCDPVGLDELRVLVLVHETCEEMVLPVPAGRSPDPKRLVSRLVALDVTSPTFPQDLEEVADSVVGRYDDPEEHRRLVQHFSSLDDAERHELGARVLACRGLFDQTEGSPDLGTVAERARQVLRSLGG
jgi:hypothetical protein